MTQQLIWTKFMPCFSDKPEPKAKVWCITNYRNVTCRKNDEKRRLRSQDWTAEQRTPSFPFWLKRRRKEPPVHAWSSYRALDHMISMGHAGVRHASSHRLSWLTLACLPLHHSKERVRRNLITLGLNTASRYMSHDGFFFRHMSHDAGGKIILLQCEASNGSGFAHCTAHLIRHYI